MSRVNNSVVFIIGPDLPSVPLLLLTHPGFALLNLQAFHDVVCLLMYLSRTFSVLSHLDLFLIPTLSLLYKISCPNFFCVYFIIIYFFFKIGLMGRVPCEGGGGAKVFSPIQTLQIKSESSTGLHPGRKTASQSRCDEMCEVLQQGQIGCKMSTESGLGHYQRQFKFKSPTTYYLLRENTDDLNVYQTANAYILWSPLQYKLYKFNNDYKELSSKQLDYLVEQRCHGVMEERKGMTILCKCSRIFFFFKN